MDYRYFGIAFAIAFVALIFALMPSKTEKIEQLENEIETIQKNMDYMHDKGIFNVENDIETLRLLGKKQYEIERLKK